MTWKNTPDRRAALRARRLREAWILSVSMLSFAAGLPAQQTATDEIAQSIAQLDSSDANTRSEAARALVKHSDVRALEPLMRILKSDADKGLLYYCSQAIVQMKDPQALEPLVKLLRDGESVAAVALGNLGDRQAVDPLLAALRETPPMEDGRRCAIIEALGRIGDAKAFDSLAPLLNDDLPQVRTRVIQALGKIGDRRATPDLIKILREDRDEFLRREAAIALGEIGDPNAVTALKAAAGDPDPYVSSLSGAALAKVEQGENQAQGQEGGAIPPAPADQGVATAGGIISDPANGATAADWTLENVTINFPFDMQTGGFAVVAVAGGKIPGPTGDAPYLFRDARTFVMRVKLEEATDYAFSLNSDRRQDFKRADGTPLPPTVIRFRTGYSNRPNMTAASPGTLVVSKAAQGGAGQYATIGEAIRQARSGDTIAISPGVYTEALVLDRPVTLLRKEGERGLVVIEAVDGPCLLMKTDRATASGLVLQGRSGTANKSFPAVQIPQGELTLVDCDITADAQSAVFVHGAGANAVVRKCRVHDAKENGIFFTDGAAGVVEESDIYANGYSNFEIRKQSNPVIRACTIRAAKNAGIYADEKGGGIISDCRIYANSIGGIQIYGGSTTKATKCAISDNAECGIDVSESAEGVFEDCDVAGNGKAGIFVTKGGNPSVLRCQFHGNKGAGAEATEQGRGSFEDCEFQANEWCEIVVRSEADPAFRGCRIHHSLQAGVLVFEKGRGRFESCTIWATKLAGVEVTTGGRPVVEQCIVRDGRDNGARCDNGSEATFSECEFSGHRLAEVMVQNGANPAFRNCKFLDGKEGGIFACANGRGTFEGCEIHANGLSGVEVCGGAHPVIRRSRISDCKESGLYVHDNGAGTFEDCEIYGNRFAGIDIHAGAAPAIRRCTVRDGKAAGILIRANAKGAIEDCKLFGNALDPITAEPGHETALKNNDEREGAVRGQ